MHTGRRRRAGDLRHHPADATARRHADSWSRWAAATGSTRRPCIAEMTYDTPALHTGIGCRPTTVADTWTTIGWCSPAHITAGASTRTARRPGCGPPSDSAPTGPRRTGWRRCACMTPSAIYRTRITHLRRAPVHHYFEQRGYSWYVDLDDLPRLPRWLRPFAKFEARDHFSTPRPSGRDAAPARRHLPGRARHRAAGRHRHRADAGHGCSATSSTR